MVDGVLQAVTEGISIGSVEVGRRVVPPNEQRLESASLAGKLQGYMSPQTSNVMRRMATGTRKGHHTTIREKHQGGN